MVLAMERVGGVEKLTKERDSVSKTTMLETRAELALLLPPTTIKRVPFATTPGPETDIESGRLTIVHSDPSHNASESSQMKPLLDAADVPS